MEEKEQRGHNRTYPKGGVLCSKVSFVVNHPPKGVFQIKFSTKNRCLRKVAENISDQLRTIAHYKNQI
jgi:hypothetical protein